MVTIHFKYTEAGIVKLDLKKPDTLASVLSCCPVKTNLRLDNAIAVRNNQVLQPTDIVQNGDVITIFPALSGG